MKKIISKLMGGVFLFSLSMSLTSCEDILGEWSRPTPNPVTPGTGEQGEVTSITVDLSKIDAKFLDTEKTKLQLTVGDEVTLSFTILPEEMADTKVELTADDETILSIDGLKVKALKAGETKVTAKAGDKTAECTVTVTPAITQLDNTTTAWTAGSYAVPAGGLTYSDAITVSGDVTLTLTDGETLTLNKGISLAEGATLTVEGNGTMNVNGTNDNSSSTVAGSGMMCFKSGTLVATGGNGHVGNDLGQHGMNGGISHGGSAINGSLTLEGGNVTATGGNGGNAGGSNSINMATGGNGGSAITGNVIINGGNWTANNGSNGTLLSGGSYNVAGTGGQAVGGTVTDNR